MNERVWLPDSKHSIFLGGEMAKRTPSQPQAGQGLSCAGKVH